jgi:hypothetical protein
MIPSVGRIVHYQRRGSADGVHKSEPSAAIVTAVVDAETVHLCVLNPEGMYFNRDVKQGDEPGQWQWPPRV